MGTRFSDSGHVSSKFSEFGVRSFGKTGSEWEHVSPTQNTFLRNFQNGRFSEKRVRSSEFLRPRTRFYDSEHVSGKTCSEWRTRFSDPEHVSPTQNTFLAKFSEFGVRSFGKTCSEWEHVSPTQNTFLRNFRSSEFGVSEKRVLSGNTFLRLRTRFSEHVFGVFGVRSFGKTCSEWEHVSPTQNTFLRLRNFRSSEFGVSEKRVLSGNTFLRLRTRFSDSEHISPKFSEFGVSEKRVLSENTFLRPRTRFYDSEHVSPKFSELGVRSFGKTCSERTRFSDPEHVFPTQNTFLRNFRSSEFGVSEKRVLSGNTFLRLRTRFSEVGVRSSEFPKNVF